MKLHDSTRRTLSLLIFFLLGPVLTIGILVGIGLRHLSFHAREFERTLSIRTGLDWSVEMLEYRRPDLIRLKNAAIAHFQASKPIFYAPEIDISFVANSNRDEFFPGIEEPEPMESRGLSALGISIPAFYENPEGFWRITIPKAVFRLEELPPENVSALIEEGFFKLLARFSTLSEQPVQIVLDEIVLQGPLGVSPPPKGAPTPASVDRIRFVVGSFYRTKDKIRSDWTFQIPSVSETEMQYLSVAASRGSSGFEIGLKTGKYPIPCDFAALFCSTFRPFSGGRFSGEITGEFRKDGLDSWTIRMRNAFFRHLDVAPFTAEYTPFEVTGTVEGLDIKHAVFGRNQFAAEGWLHVVNGSIEQTLFNRLVDRFSLTVNPESILEAPFGSIHYDRSLVFFRLMQDGAAFWAEQPKKLFMSRDADGVSAQPIAVSFPANNNRQPISYHAIMSALAPDTAPIVPLTPGSQKIISILPTDSFSRPVPSAPHPVPASIRPMTADPWTAPVPATQPPSPAPSDPPPAPAPSFSFGPIAPQPASLYRVPGTTAPVSSAPGYAETGSAPGVKSAFEAGIPYPLSVQ